MVDFLRRSWAVVDLDCIDYNIRSIKQKLKPGCMIMGVVKADAYGHGDKYIADELVFVWEWTGLRYPTLPRRCPLRNQGIYHPILILGTTPPKQSKTALRIQYYSRQYFRWSMRKKLQQQAQRGCDGRPPH